MKTDRSDFEIELNELTYYHKTRISELYETWKKDYTALENDKCMKENELLSLQELCGKQENQLLESEKQIRELEKYKVNYETLQIKFDTESIKQIKSDEKQSKTQQLTIKNLCGELKKAENENLILQEKIKKIQFILNLEVEKSKHLREKCRDYWTLLTAKDGKLKLVNETIEKQIIERQQLLKQIEFYKIGCGVQNRLNDRDFYDEKPSHDISITNLVAEVSKPNPNAMSKSRSKLNILEQLRSKESLGWNGITINQTQNLNREVCPLNSSMSVNSDFKTRSDNIINFDK